MTKTLRIGTGYIEFGHGPAAEEGHEPAERLMQACKGRKIIEVDLTDDALFEELRTVAELNDHPEVNDHAPNHRRTARRILRAQEDFVLGIERR